MPQISLGSTSVGSKLDSFSVLELSSVSFLMLNVAACIVLSGSARMLAPLSSLRPGRALSRTSGSSKRSVSNPSGLRPLWSVALDICLAVAAASACAMVVVDGRLYRDAATLVEMVQ